MAPALLNGPTMRNRSLQYAIAITATLAVGCSASSGDADRQTEGAASTGTVYNFGTLANPGSCLDALSGGTSDGTPLQEWLCNGTGAQSYAVVAAPNGTVNLVNTQANKCVDISSSGTANGTKVQLWDCNGTSAQTFILQDAGSGFVNIVNTHSEKCIDVSGDNPGNGTKVQLWDCNGTSAQLWNPAAIGVVASGSGSSGSSSSLAQCDSAQLAECNCPSSFSCCPTDGSCFATMDQLEYTMCKNAPSSACAMSGASGEGSTGSGTSTGSGSSTGSGITSGGSTSGGGTTVSTCGKAVGPGDRVITVTNECPGQTLSVGINGGYVQDCVDGACPTGMTCDTGRSPAGCFWDFPAPACGSSVLGSGATATYVLPAPAAGSAITWSGNVYAATQCAGDGTGCGTAQCALSLDGKTVVGPCPDGTGPEGPTTLAEFTLVPGGSDFYDVSSINGVNVPVSMGPLSRASDPSNPYTCATAGAVNGSTGLLGCSWGFDTNIALASGVSNQSTLLRAVSPGGNSCGSDSDCGGGQVCGTALAFGGASATQSCGKQIAWWTADELCAYTGNTLGGAVRCDQGVAGQGNQANLYGCNGANATSGYSTSASSTSCGCPEWSVGGQSVAVAPGFSCHNTNPAWQSVAQPWAAFLKNACPTSYSFPFDDATSTFTCTTASPSASHPNSTGYAITFCPGGKTGM